MPCGGGNAPLYPSTGFILYVFGAGDTHPLMESGGVNISALFMPEVFSIGTIGRDVRRRFRIVQSVHPVHCLTWGDVVL